MPTGTHHNNPSFGRVSDPCPECGHMALHRSVALEGEKTHVVQKCSYRHCGREWIDGKLVPLTARQRRERGEADGDE